MIFFKNKGFIIRFLITLFLLGSLLSCNRVCTKKDMLEYLKDPANGLIKEIKEKEYNMVLTYRPTGLLFSQEKSKNSNIQQNEIKEIQKSYTDYYHFIIEFSSENNEFLQNKKKGTLDFKEQIEHFSFDLKDRCIIVTSSKDTVPAGDCISPRMFGTTHSNSVMLIFKKQKIESSEWFDFVFYDPDIEIGYNKIRFKTEDIRTSDKIELNK